MTNIRLDTSFPHLYEVEVRKELPSSESISQIYFPGATSGGGKDGLLVKVSPHQSLPWIGTFAFGYKPRKALSGIFSLPEASSVCVVSAGQGYLVRVDDPSNWEQVRSYPIVEVRPLVERQLCLFADFTTLAAYGLKGLRWITTDLSWDGLKITEVTPDYIKGLGWDAVQEREVEYLVDVKTGHHRGGSSPQQYVST